MEVDGELVEPPHHQVREHPRKVNPPYHGVVAVPRILHREVDDVVVDLIGVRGYEIVQIFLGLKDAVDPVVGPHLGEEPVDLPPPVYERVLVDVLGLVALGPEPIIGDLEDVGSQLPHRVVRELLIPLQRLVVGHRGVLRYGHPAPDIALRRGVPLPGEHLHELGIQPRVDGDPVRLLVADRGEVALLRRHQFTESPMDLKANGVCYILIKNKP